HTLASLALAILEEAGFPDGEYISDTVFLDKVGDVWLDKNLELARGCGGQSRPRAMARAVRLSLRDLTDAGIDPAQIQEYFGEEYTVLQQGQVPALLNLAKAYQAKLKGLGVLSSSG